MIKSKNLKYQLGIILIAALIYIPLIGKVHLFDWDEINFAESAREMIETNDYLTVQINYQPFWEKPPLFIWGQVISMKLFGINEFASRLPNAICGILTLLVLFNLGTRLRNRQFGLFWALSHGASILPLLYFKSGIIDPWFNLFIFLAIHHAILFINSQKDKNVILSAFFIGLSVLTKGPAGFLIFGLTAFIFLIIKRFKIKITFRQIIYFLLFFGLIGGLWFIILIFSGNKEIIKDFIYYQMKLFSTKDAGHGGFLFYHFVVLFFGVFPASIFALNPLLRKYYQDKDMHDYMLVMKILFWVVLILFTIVKTKIVHYSSMCYFPISFLAASFLEKYMSSKTGFTKIQNVSIWVILNLCKSCL